MAMKLEYVKCVTYKKERNFVCPHNDACRCEVKNCYNCGWNPKVEKLRMQKILGTKVED
jgi:hypothetical protein